MLVKQAKLLVGSPAPVAALKAFRGPSQRLRTSGTRRLDGLGHGRGVAN